MQGGWGGRGKSRKRARDSRHEHSLQQLDLGPVQTIIITFLHSHDYQTPPDKDGDGNNRDGMGGVHEYQTSISNIQSHTRRSEYMVIGQLGMKTQCEGNTKHICMYVRNMHIHKYSSPKMVNFEDVPLPL